MDERIGFGIYQSCGNRGNVGRVSLFCLFRGLDQSLEGWGGIMSV